MSPMNLKNQSIYQKPVLYMAIMVFIFLFSISGFFLFKSYQKIVVLYPLDNMENVEGELRTIPFSFHRNLRIEFFLKEMLLHPVSVHLNPIVPEGVALNFFIYDQETKELYLDISDDVVLVDRIHQRYPDDARMLSIIKENVRYNFHFINKIYISIDGMVPFEPLHKKK